MSQVVYSQLERRRLDRRVYNTLRLNPMPAIDLCNALGMDWGTEAAELRGSLLRLQQQGKADIRYGLGWFRTPEVKP